MKKAGRWALKRNGKRGEKIIKKIVMKKTEDNYNEDCEEGKAGDNHKMDYIAAKREISIKKTNVSKTADNRKKIDVGKTADNRKKIDVGKTADNRKMDCYAIKPISER